MQIQKFKALQSRGLKKNDKPGIVKIFFNPCQLLEHMQVHNSEEVSIQHLMLLPFPSGIGKEYYPHLKMISEALIDFMFLANIHIVDWLSQNKIHKWWRMAKGDNPVANIIKKYPFEVQQIKQLLNCNNKVNHSSEPNEHSTILTEHHNKINTSIASQTLLNSNNSTLNQQAFNEVTPSIFKLDSQTHLGSTEDITFVDCGSCDNEYNLDVNNKIIVDSNNVSVTPNIKKINSTLSSTAKITVKKFAKVSTSLTKHNATTIITNSNDIVHPSTSPIKNFPQITHRVARNKVGFLPKDLTTDNNSTDPKILLGDKFQNMSLLKTRKIQYKEQKLIRMHKLQQQSLKSMKPINTIFKPQLNILKLTNQQVTNSNKFKKIVAKKPFNTNTIKFYLSEKSQNMNDVIKISQTLSSNTQNALDNKIVPVNPECTNCLSTDTDDMYGNSIKLIRENLKLFLSTLKKSNKKILEQFFHEDQLMHLSIKKNEKSGKSFLSFDYKENPSCINDTVSYRNKMFLYLNKMSRAKVCQCISHIKAISRKYSEKVGVLKDEIIEGHERLLLILEDIAAHIDSPTQSIRDEYFDPLLDPISGETCPTCKRIMKSSEYVIGFSNIVVDLDYCLCYDFICYKCNTYQGNKERFHAHLNYHKSENPYICPECNISFPSFQSLNVHIWTKCFHPLVRRFLSCSICEINGFCSLESIMNHFVSMHSSKIAACNTCCMVFEYKCYCVSHMKKDHDSNIVNSDDPLQLTICQLDDKIMPIECYNYHMKSHECVQESLFYECNFCLGYKKLFKSQESIKTHIYKSHASDLSTFIDINSLKEIITKSDIKQLLTEIYVFDTQNIQTSTSLLNDLFTAKNLQNKKVYLQNSILHCNNQNSLNNSTEKLTIINDDCGTDDFHNSKCLLQLTTGNVNTASENVLNINKRSLVKSNYVHVTTSILSLDQDGNNDSLLNNETNLKISIFSKDDKIKIMNKSYFEDNNENKEDLLAHESFHLKIVDDLIDENAKDPVLHGSSDLKFSDSFEKVDRENTIIHKPDKPMHLTFSNVEGINEIISNKNETIFSESVYQDELPTKLNKKNLIFSQNTNNIPTALEGSIKKNEKEVSINNKCYNFDGKEFSLLTSNIANNMSCIRECNALNNPKTPTSSKTTTAKECSSLKLDSLQCHTPIYGTVSKDNSFIPGNTDLSICIHDEANNLCYTELQQTSTEEIIESPKNNKYLNNSVLSLNKNITQTMTVATNRHIDHEKNNLVPNNNLKDNELSCKHATDSLYIKDISVHDEINKKGPKPSMNMTNNFLLDIASNEVTKNVKSTLKRILDCKETIENNQIISSKLATLSSSKTDTIIKNIKQSINKQECMYDDSGSNDCLKNQRSPHSTKAKIVKATSEIGNIKRTDPLTDSVCNTCDDSKNYKKLNLRNFLLEKKNEKSSKQSFQKPETFLKTSLRESVSLNIDKDVGTLKNCMALESFSKSINCESTVDKNTNNASSFNIINIAVNDECQKQSMFKENISSVNRDIIYLPTKDVSNISKESEEKLNKNITLVLNKNRIHNLKLNDKNNTLNTVQLSKFAKESDYKESAIQSEINLVTILENEVSLSESDSNIDKEKTVLNDSTLKSTENLEKQITEVINDNNTIEEYIQENVIKMMNIQQSRFCETASALQIDTSKKQTIENYNILCNKTSEQSSSTSTSVFNENGCESYKETVNNIEGRIHEVTITLSNLNNKDSITSLVDQEIYEKNKKTRSTNLMDEDVHESNKNDDKNCKISNDSINEVISKNAILTSIFHTENKISSIDQEKQEGRRNDMEDEISKALFMGNNIDNENDINSSKIEVNTEVSDESDSEDSINIKSIKTSIQEGNHTNLINKINICNIDESNEILHREEEQSTNQLTSTMYIKIETEQSSRIDTQLSNNKDDSNYLFKESNNILENVTQSTKILSQNNISINEGISEKSITGKINVLNNECTLDNREHSSTLNVNNTTKYSIYKHHASNVKRKQSVTIKKRRPVNNRNVKQIEMTTNGGIDIAEKNKIFDISVVSNLILEKKHQEIVDTNRLVTTNKRLSTLELQRDSIEIKTNNEIMFQSSCNIGNDLNSTSSNNYRYSTEENPNFTKINQGSASKQKLCVLDKQEKPVIKSLEVIKTTKNRNSSDLQIENNQISKNNNKLVSDSDDSDTTNHSLKVKNNKELSVIEETVKCDIYELKYLPLTDDEKLTLSKNPVSNKKRTLNTYSVVKENDNIKKLRTRIINKSNDSSKQISKIKRKTSSNSLLELNDKKQINAKKIKFELEQNDTMQKPKSIRRKKTNELKFNLNIKGKLRNSISKNNYESSNINEYSEENIQNQIIDSQFENIIRINRTLRRSKSLTPDDILSNNVQKIKVGDSKFSTLPTLRLINKKTQMSGNKFSILSEKYPTLKAIKRHKIGFCSSTENSKKIYKFKCHLCSDIINTSWLTINEHYNRKHVDNYKLCMISPELTRLSDNDIIDINKKKTNKKRKFIESSSMNIKKKKRWSLKKMNEKPIISERTSGLFVQLESLIDVEGHFKCKKCNECCINMVELRQHIVDNHRIARKNLICLECGENFVVSPSLQMHLKAFHGIQDPVTYMNQYPDYTPDIVDTKTETKVTAPNQCHVCMAVFKDKASVDKHLRVHGMAFLNKKRIEARNSRPNLNETEQSIQEYQR